MVAVINWPTVGHIVLVGLTLYWAATAVARPLQRAILRWQVNRIEQRFDKALGSLKSEWNRRPQEWQPDAEEEECQDRQ